MVKIPNLDYKPTFDHVKGTHIAVITVIVLLLFWMYKGGISLFQPYAAGGGLRNGDGASQYVDVQSFNGWVATQYNSLGAQAGALNGESN